MATPRFLKPWKQFVRFSLGHISILLKFKTIQSLPNIPLDSPRKQSVYLQEYWQTNIRKPFIQERQTSLLEVFGIVLFYSISCILTSNDTATGEHIYIQHEPSFNFSLLPLMKTDFVPIARRKSRTSIGFKNLIFESQTLYKQSHSIRSLNKTFRN